MPTGIGEWLIVFMVLLLIFGASRLPQLGEGIGKAIRGLKRGLATDEEIDVTPQAPAAPQVPAATKEPEIASSSVVTPPAVSDGVTDAEIVSEKSS